MNNINIRVNNFDLLRLLAASQVMIMHGMVHLNAEWIPFQHVLSYFPGVPIFFVISGFLISASFERNSNLWQYAQNRMLRIFPALWVCLVASIAIALIVGGVSFPLKKTVVWLAAQTTFAQFYNPDFLRGFGTGVLNGSLWTVSVELQFYLALPIIYWVIKGKSTDTKLMIGSIILAFFNMYVVSIRSSGINVEHGVIQLNKLLTVFLPTHLYLFFVGILLRRNYGKLAIFLEGKGFFWLVIYVIVSFGSMPGHYLNPVEATILGITTVSVAFTLPNLSMKILGGNDLSYGVYIYHMPIINALMYLSITGRSALFIAVVLAYAAALLSWCLVEKPSLRLKKNPLHPTI